MQSTAKAASEGRTQEGEPGLRVVTDLDDARALAQNGPKLTAMRRAAEGLHDRFVAGPRVVSVRTLDVATLLYPTRFAFNGAATNPSPYVVMTHRTLLVQFLQRGELKNLLFNPTDTFASRATPYFKKTIDDLGEFLAFRVLTKTYAPIETGLAAQGLSPSDIDYVAFDHFHTQDLRTLLGTIDGRVLSRFPRAKLLAPKVEWDAWDDLHPLQRAWFVKDGKALVATKNVILTTRDLELGDGVMLLQTPGHTAGNQTLFMNTDGGVWGCSENGTCVDAWSPLASRIGGLVRYARHHEHEVVLNANTPEWMADQYTSMVVERTLASRVKSAPAFVQMFSSSEVTKSPLCPGLKPTITFGKIESGIVARANVRPVSRPAMATATA